MLLGGVDITEGTTPAAPTKILEPGVHYPVSFHEPSTRLPCTAAAAVAHHVTVPVVTELCVPMRNPGAIQQVEWEGGGVEGGDHLVQCPEKLKLVLEGVDVGGVCAV